MYRVYSGCTDLAKLEGGKSCADFLKLLRQNSLADAPKGQMRGEGAFLFIVPEAGRAILDRLLQGGKHGWGVESDPKYARPF